MELGYFTLGFTDTAMASRFYRELFGWQTEQGNAGAEYAHVNNTQLPLGFTPDGVDSPPVLYFRVADAEAYAARVRELGGTRGQRGDLRLGRQRRVPRRPGPRVPALAAGSRVLGTACGLLRCPAMEMHYATIWESIADEIPDEVALVHGRHAARGRSTTSAPPVSPLRTSTAGLGHDSKVGLYLYNGNEYLEAQYGAFKMRGVPVNVNYRYLDEELWYLLDNADAEALVFHASLGDRVARVVDRLPKLRLLVEVDDGGDRAGRPRAVPYEEVDRRARADGAHRRDPRTTSTCSTPAAPPACRRA